VRRSLRATGFSGSVSMSSGSSARRSARVLAFLTCSRVGASGMMAAAAAVAVVRLFLSMRYPVVENCTRFDFADDVAVVELFEAFEAVIGTGASQRSSRSSGRSRCSSAPHSRWMWAEVNRFQANWADVIVVISVVRCLIVESLLYILSQILKTFQFFFIFIMKYDVSIDK